MRLGKTMQLSRTVMVVLSMSMVTAQSAKADFSFQTGLDYTSGDYGAVEDTRILYVPFTIKYESQNYVVRLTAPYIRIDSPVGGEIIGISASGQPIRAGTGEREVNDGLGDVVLAAGYTVVNTGGGTLVDITAKTKFGTADDSKGLGTGENDYSLQFDWSTRFGRFSPLATIGYRVYGDPPDIDFDNAFFGSIGGVFRFSAGTSGGLIYDTRQNILANTDPQRELTAFVSHRIDKDAKIQSYVIGGFSDSSPDWGVGLMFTVGL